MKKVLPALYQLTVQNLRWELPARWNLSFPLKAKKAMAEVEVKMAEAIAKVRVKMAEAMAETSPSRAGEL